MSVQLVTMPVRVNTAPENVQVKPSSKMTQYRVHGVESSSSNALDKFTVPAPAEHPQTMLHITDTEPNKIDASYAKKNSRMASANTFAATHALSNIEKGFLTVATPSLMTRGLPEQSRRTSTHMNSTVNLIRCWGSDEDTTATITDGSYSEKYVGNYPAAYQADQSHDRGR